MINPDKSWAGTPNTRRLQVLSQYHYARPYKKLLSNSNLETVPKKNDTNIFSCSTVSVDFSQK